MVQYLQRSGPSDGPNRHQVEEQTTSSVSEQLRRYAAAARDPTRGSILIELGRAGEATATQLARRLGQTPNNVYHHLRVLLELGVVEPPRSVPGPTYVEKFYRITDETRAALHMDYGWYHRQAQDSLTLEDRKALIVSMCYMYAHLLRQTAREYEALDAAELDRVINEDKLLLLSFSRIGRNQFKARLAALRSMMEHEAFEFAEDTSPRSDLAIMAMLPFLLDGDGE